MDLLVETLNSWKKAVDKKYGTGKFLWKDRDVVLDSLAEMLKERSVSLEDALSLKYVVTKFLVTTQGLKGTNKHKGWKEAVEIDFDAAIMAQYPPETDPNAPIKTIVKSFEPVKEEYGVYPYLPQNAIITAWAQDRFGEVWNEKINLEAHKHWGKFNEDFRREVMDSEWARSGNDAPEWYQKLIA